jgi:hypothetical protein
MVVAMLFMRPGEECSRKPVSATPEEIEKLTSNAFTAWGTSTIDFKNSVLIFDLVQSVTYSGDRSAAQLDDSFLAPITSEVQPSYA